MIVVLDPQGREYARADLSGPAIENAVRKHSPDCHKRERRRVWIDMKAKGFSVVERKTTG